MKKSKKKLAPKSKSKPRPKSKPRAKRKAKGKAKATTRRATRASSAGGDATWNATPADGLWNNAANWSSGAVPTGTAVFGASTQTNIAFAASASAAVEEIVFASGAPPYTVGFTANKPSTPTLAITGNGVVNESDSVQSFVVAAYSQSDTNAQLLFSNSASAGGQNVSYAAGPATSTGPAGGVIGFSDRATAGAASFTVRTGSGLPPTIGLVGAEVAFTDNSSAGTARFTIYGSTGNARKGDTFANTVFHHSATAANATFTNIGGTLAKCDGGNTQFYDTATAANARFHNLGATVSDGNGGDVAFDGTANAGQGQFHNYAAPVNGGHGGVTSFNNNKPAMPANTIAASAGNGWFFNYGANANGQGGGHTSFSGDYGAGTGANGTFVNFGAGVAGESSIAGHTVLSITTPQTGGPYIPTAGNGTFWNLPGTANQAPGGSTQFAVYTKNSSGQQARRDNPEKRRQGAARRLGGVAPGTPGPTAGNGTFMNLGATTEGASGGQTEFTETSTAANATLIAIGGLNGGFGGRVAFSDNATGGTAKVQLSGNGTLDVSYLDATNLTLGSLQVSGGTISTSVGNVTPAIVVANDIVANGTALHFDFHAGAGFVSGTPYTILTAPNLSDFALTDFTGSSVNNLTPTFTIAGDSLQVTFG